MQILESFLPTNWQKNLNIKPWIALHQSGGVSCGICKALNTIVSVVREEPHNLGHIGALRIKQWQR